MGNCKIIHKEVGTQLLYICCSDETQLEQKEVNCGGENISYYTNYKIEKFTILFDQQIFFIKLDSKTRIDIEPSKIYFQIMKKNSNKCFVIIY